MGFNRSLVLDNRVSFAAITVDISFVNKAQISKQKKQDFIYGLFFLPNEAYTSYTIL